MMKKIRQLIKKMLPKNQFIRGVGVLVFGTSTAQILTVLAAPLITRLYTPANFGILAVYSGLLSMILVIGSLRYELAIPLPGDDQEAANIVVICLVILLSIVILSTFIVLIFNNKIAYALNAPELAPYLWLLPLGILLSGIYQVFHYWAIRIKSFTAISKTKISQVVANLGIQSLGYKFGTLALISAQIAGQAMGGGSLCFNAIKKTEFKHITLTGIKASMSRYKRFPILSVWSGLFNIAANQLVPILFVAFFNPVIAGLYALTHRVFALPISVIGSAIANVFFANASEAYRNGNIGPLVAKVHDKLAQIGMLPILFIVFSGPKLFTLVFGNNWTEAGQYAQWMAPWFYVVFVTSPLSTLFAVMEKQTQGVFFQGLLLSVSVTTLLAGSSTGNILFTVAILSIGNTLCYMGFLTWIITKSGNSIILMVKSTFRSLLWGLIILTPLVLIQQFSSNNILWFISIGLTLILILTRYFYLFKRFYK